jgi:hypothetical protein
MKFLGAFVILCTLWLLFIIYITMDTIHSNEDIRRAIFGGWIIIGLLCLGSFLLYY